MEKQLFSKTLGPIFVLLGASLWATDTLFRFPMIYKLDAELIVFIEHLIAFIFLLPLFYGDRNKFMDLNLKQWTALSLIGIFGSALATILFTRSFLLINPSVVILLQKTQSILVSFLAILFLNERPHWTFIFWAPIALFAALVLSFPNMEFLDFDQLKNSSWQGLALAIGAAALWAGSTVLGKSTLKKVSPIVVTFWRFWFGLSCLITIQIFSFKNESFTILKEIDVWRSLTYMALIPGLIAVWFYYEGLKRTQAFIATFLELAFPITAVALNTYFLNLPITMTQLIAAGLLLTAVSAISLGASVKISPSNLPSIDKEPMRN